MRIVKNSGGGYFYSVRLLSRPALQVEENRDISLFVSILFFNPYLLSDV